MTERELRVRRRAPGGLQGAASILAVDEVPKGPMGKIERIGVSPSGSGIAGVDAAPIPLHAAEEPDRAGRLRASGLRRSASSGSASTTTSSPSAGDFVLGAELSARWPSSRDGAPADDADVDADARRVRLSSREREAGRTMPASCRCRRGDRGPPLFVVHGLGTRSSTSGAEADARHEQPLYAVRALALQHPVRHGGGDRGAITCVRSGPSSRRAPICSPSMCSGGAIVDGPRSVRTTAAIRSPSLPAIDHGAIRSGPGAALRPPAPSTSKDGSSVRRSDRAPPLARAAHPRPVPSRAGAGRGGRLSALTSRSSAAATASGVSTGAAHRRQHD